jgi:hypothetical protein
MNKACLRNRFRHDISVCEVAALYATDPPSARCKSIKKPAKDWWRSKCPQQAHLVLGEAASDDIDAAEERLGGQVLHVKDVEVIPDPG